MSHKKWKNIDQIYSCNSRPAPGSGWTLDRLTAGEGFGGKCNWTNPPPYRIQNAEWRVQNAEYRMQHTEDRIHWQPLWLANFLQCTVMIERQGCWQNVKRTLERSGSKTLEYPLYKMPPKLKKKLFNAFQYAAMSCCVNGIITQKIFNYKILW